MSVLCIVAVGLASLLVHDVTSVPLIRAPWGSIQGVEVQGRNGKKMNGYLGIPYALPPTGKLRWQKPQPHPGPGDGRVFEATTLLPACPQELPGIGVYNGTSEDCLTLNVFVPVSDDVTSRTPKPVMVWIHGGGFFMGDAASFRPTKLVTDNDVIVVTIQYRLGALGFLSTGDATAPGNYGLWDQRQALVWVKDNIRAFGGDPNLVTLFGESAGGMSVGLQLLSPASRGLFRRAVAQSGSPYFLTCYSDRAAADFRSLAEAMGCALQGDDVSGLNSREVLDCLRDRPLDELMNVTLAMTKRALLSSIFSVRTDGEFLTDTPARLIEDEVWMAQTGSGEVDILTGFNNNEGALLLFIGHMFPGFSPETLQSTAFFRGFLQLSTSCINYGQPSEVAAKVLEFLYRDFDAFTEKPVSVARFTELYGDTLIAVPSVRWIRQLAALPHSGRRYLYLFDHDLSYNRGGPAPGMQHGDDVLFEFEFIAESIAMVGKTGPFPPEEERLSSEFVTMLTDFARTGNPTASLSAKMGGDLPEFSVEDEAYLSLTINPSVQHHLWRQRMAVWIQLIPELLSAIKPPSQEQTTAQTQVKDEF